MNNPRISSRPPLASLTAVAVTALLMLQGCTTYVQQPAPPPRVVYPAPSSPPLVYTPAPQQVVSVYVDPPITQPAPLAVPWAPPPLLVEVPPPMRFDGAVWVGGYWHWEGAWVWARGRWLAPPQPSYAWVQPYYENRAGTVVFITGHWSPPGVVFVPPPPTLHISLAVVTVGAIPGPAPIGPSGVFIPAPPGSRPGLIIPAPIGTAPAVVTSAPPVVNVGMRVVTTNSAVDSNNRVINSVTNVTTINNVTNISRVTNVTIVAPAGATASGQPVSASVPAQAHLAAALPPVVHAYAPEPASARAISAAALNRAPMALPPAQAIRPSAETAQQRLAAPVPAPVQHPATAAPSVGAVAERQLQSPAQPAQAARPSADPVPQRLAVPVPAPIQHPATIAPLNVGIAAQPQLRTPAQPVRVESKEGLRERTVHARAVGPEDAQKARPGNRGEQQRGGREPASQIVGRKPAKGAAGQAAPPTQEHRARQGEHER